MGRYKIVYDWYFFFDVSEQQPSAGFIKFFFTFPGRYREYSPRLPAEAPVAAQSESKFP